MTIIISQGDSKKINADVVIEKDGVLVNIPPKKSATPRRQNQYGSVETQLKSVKCFKCHQKGTCGKGLPTDCRLGLCLLCF